MRLLSIRLPLPLQAGVFPTLALATALVILPVRAAAAQTTPEQPPANSTAQPGDLACGVDLSCFAAQAATCTPSTVTYTLMLDLAPLVGLHSGLQSNTTDGFRMQPDPNGSADCQLSLVVQQVDNRVLPEAVQELQSRGVTPDQIEQTRSSMAESAKVLEGRSGTCLFAPDDLAAMLQQWVSGSFTSADFAAGACEGTYFSST